MEIAGGAVGVGEAVRMDDDSLGTILRAADHYAISFLDASALAHHPAALGLHETAVHSRLARHRPAAVGVLHVCREIRRGEEPVRKDAIELRRRGLRGGRLLQL